MWFNPDKVLSYNMLFNFILGNRGGGKTFNTLDFVIKRFKKHGEQFAYVRTTEKELDLCKGTMFNGLKAEGFHSDDEIKVDGLDIMCNGKIMGVCIPLSLADQFKSTAYPHIKWIIYEEFIEESGRKKLRDRAAKFFGLYETIARMRDVYCFFLANSVTISNDFFDFLKIKPQRGSKFSVFKEKEALIHLFVDADYVEAKKATRFGKVITNTTLGEYMIDNHFLNDNYLYVEPMEGAGVYQATIAYNGHKYGLYWQGKKGIFHINDSVDDGCNMRFAFTTVDHEPNYILFASAKNNPYIKRLIMAYDIGLVRFGSLTCKNDMYELFKYL